MTKSKVNGSAEQFVSTFDKLCSGGWVLLKCPPACSSREWMMIVSYGANRYSTNHPKVVLMTRNENGHRRVYRVC